MTSLTPDATRDALIAAADDPDRRILISGGWVVTMGAQAAVQADVLIVGDTIQEVAPGLTDRIGDAIVVDASNAIIIPGLVDSHLHAWEGQLRGIAPDADFGNYMALTHDGLAKHYRPEDMAIAERLSAAQAINAGTTTIIDNSHNSRTADHSNAAIEALLSTGIRAVYAAGSAQAGEHDGQLPHDLLRLRDEYFSGGSDLVSLRMFDIQPSIETWTFAADHGFDICAEMGMWVPDLDKLVASGLMREGHTYNHCSGIPDEVWKAIADSGAAINMVPRSDSYFGLGAFAPILQANRYGIQEGISSDNETSYGHDLFTEMRTLLTVQRGLSFQEEFSGATEFPDRYGVLDVLRAATIGGAINAGLTDRIGTIEAGRKADIVVLHLAPVNTRLWGSVVGTVVNYAGPANVDAVLIDGEVKKFGGELVGVDYDALVREGEASRNYLLAAYGTSLDAARVGLKNEVDKDAANDAITSIVTTSGH